MAVTRRTLVGMAVLFLLIMGGVAAFAQTTGRANDTIGGWRIQDVLVVVGIGINIGFTLLKVKVNEEATGEIKGWIRDHGQRADVLRREYDERFRAVHDRINHLAERD